MLPFITSPTITVEHDVVSTSIRRLYDVADVV